MSRQSRPSLWAQGQTLLKPDSEECSIHLVNCLHNFTAVSDALHRTQTNIRSATSDLPRLSNVLHNERLFVVVNEDVVRRYAAQLTDEIEPQISELLLLANRGLKTLERTKLNLQNKMESTAQKSQMTVSATSKMDLRRLNLLASQRERLKVELQSLERDIAQLEEEEHRSDDVE